jgi:hypothetical protein
MPRVVVFDEFGGPDVMHVVEEPAARPAAGEVRVRIEAFAANPLDQMMRSGTSPAPVPCRTLASASREPASSTRWAPGSPGWRPATRSSWRPFRTPA